MRKALSTSANRRPFPPSPTIPTRAPCKSRVGRRMNSCFCWARKNTGRLRNTPASKAIVWSATWLASTPEALVTTMETNQKFVPTFGTDGRLTEHFIGVANIESKDPAEIRKGYERVIRPRFADAKFFFDEDLKQGLASMNEGLKTVTYQAKLGTVWDKAQRVAALAESIAGEVGVDPKLAKRAALLAKADLQSRMVNEFPELQGIAGRYYAMHDASLNDLSADERRQLADALDEVYMPRFAGDAIARGGHQMLLQPAHRASSNSSRLTTSVIPTQAAATSLAVTPSGPGKAASLLPPSRFA